MRNALNAITEELRRLKQSGARTIAVSDESVAALRKALAGRKAASPARPPAAKVSTNAAAPAPAMKNEPIAMPTLRTRTSTAIEKPKAPTQTLPAAPTVTLPAGDKAKRWT